jgi:hypothetical protein
MSANEGEGSPNPDQSNGEGGKRRRTESPDGRDMIPFELVMDKLTTTLSSVFASAINSCESGRERERENFKNLLQTEQFRREKAETELRELRENMVRKLVEQRRVVEEEAEARYKKLEADLQELGRLKVVIYFSPG